MVLDHHFHLLLGLLLGLRLLGLHGLPLLQDLALNHLVLTSQFVHRLGSFLLKFFLFLGWSYWLLLELLLRLSQLGLLVLL